MSLSGHDQYVTTPAVPHQGLRIVEGVSIVRLHGEACIDCGTTAGPLLPAGHVHTSALGGGFHGWAVVACPEHTEGQ